MTNIVLSNAFASIIPSALQNLVTIVGSLLPQQLPNEQHWVLYINPVIPQQAGFDLQPPQQYLHELIYDLSNLDYNYHYNPSVVHVPNLLSIQTDSKLPLLTTILRFNLSANWGLWINLLQP